MNIAMKVKMTALEALTPYARNARKHSKRQIRQIEKSICEFGWMFPILIDHNGVIIAGHARYEAAKRLGLKVVPTIRVEHLTEKQIKAYRLADNKLAENAEWDEALLRIELSDLQFDSEIDFDTLGFSTPEVDLLLSSTGLVDEDVSLPALPPPDAVVTQLGDIWALGDSRCASGDVGDPDFMDQVMGDQRATMAFTDPPYNVPIPGHVSGLGNITHSDFSMGAGEMSAEEFTQFLVAALTQITRLTLPGAIIFVCMDWRHMQELLAAAEAAGLSLHNLCVWSKTNAGMGSLYRSQHELVFVFKHGSAPHINNVNLGAHGRTRTNVWCYPGMNAFGEERDQMLSMHPTVKPLQMVTDAILDVSNRGDIVFDGFLGSGTTLLAAQRSGRICYGLEIDPRYVDVTLRRWMRAAGEVPVLLETGASFHEVAAARGCPVPEEA